jgi:hypothetical protein
MPIHNIYEYTAPLLLKATVYGGSGVTMCLGADRPITVAIKNKYKPAKLQNREPSLICNKENRIPTAHIPNAISDKADIAFLALDEFLAGCAIFLSFT